MTDPGRPLAYRLLASQSLFAERGATVYLFMWADWHLCRDAEAATGLPHIPVTLDPAGGPPFLPVPARELERVEAERPTFYPVVIGASDD